MGTSMNDKTNTHINAGPQEGHVDNMRDMRGAFADGLTLIRFLLTFVVMGVILAGWPQLHPALLATFLLIVAALTDIWDDIIGGSERSKHRKFGWFDDIADMVLILGTLCALLYVVWKNGVLGWGLAVPAIIIIAREVIIGFARGYEFSKYGWPTTKWGWLKNTMTIAAVCVLLASPWLTTWVDMRRATDTNIVDIYNATSPHIWISGQIMLWLAAAISVLTGIAILRGDASEYSNTENEAG